PVMVKPIRATSITTHVAKQAGFEPAPPHFASLWSAHIGSPSWTFISGPGTTANEVGYKPRCDARAAALAWSTHQFGVAAGAWEGNFSGRPKTSQFATRSNG